RFRHELGAAGTKQRVGLSAIFLPRQVGACGWLAVVWAQRARRGRIDEHRLEFPARTPSPAAAIALRHPERRRSAERCAVRSERLVLLPRTRFPEDQGAL